MNPLPSHDLERKAAEQRRRLHGSMVELRSRVRNRLDIKRNARNNFGLAAGGAALVGVVSGYLVAGVFVGHKRSK
jgi:hypothetical protein